MTTGDGRKLKRARDTLIMRMVVTGRQGDLVGEKNLGGQWGMVLQGLKEGMGGRAEN